MIRNGPERVKVTRMVCVLVCVSHNLLVTARGSNKSLLRVVSYVNVHPSVRRPVYRFGLGNAKFTATITSWYSLSCRSTDPFLYARLGGVPPLKYTLLPRRTARQQRSLTSRGFPSRKTICSTRVRSFLIRDPRELIVRSTLFSSVLVVLGDDKSSVGIPSKLRAISVF